MSGLVWLRWDISTACLLVCSGDIIVLLSGEAWLAAGYFPQLPPVYLSVNGFSWGNKGRVTALTELRLRGWLDGGIVSLSS